WLGWCIVHFSQTSPTVLCRAKSGLTSDCQKWAEHDISKGQVVNGINLRSATHDEAINVLRQTPQKVRLTVYRDEAQYKEDDMWDTFSVELHKQPGESLGLSIVGKSHMHFPALYYIVKGGVVEKDGQLMQGDQILSVNGEDVRTATQEAVAALLKVQKCLKRRSARALWRWGETRLSVTPHFFCPRASFVCLQNQNNGRGALPFAPSQISCSVQH
uniref:PDZ domain-containing protein n=1 Tax=Erpetoichthys calabaricus TaxID=27687 RepID=A0A8C4SHA1_ERPCA